MRHMGFLTMALLAATALPALAQTPPAADPITGARAGNVIGSGSSLPVSQSAGNTGAGTVRSGVVPNLPMPAIGPDATTVDYLRAARASLLAGRTGAAQQALEMAETRALNRSVEPDKASLPSENRAVQQIAEAIQALGRGQRDQALQLIDSALLP